VISGNFVVAMPFGVIDGVDLQHTGKVRKVHTKSLNAALDSGAVVLLSPIAYSPTGEIFNLTFSDVATHVAGAIKADKLLAFVEGHGVSDEEGSYRYRNAKIISTQTAQLSTMICSKPSVPAI
jgi:amino-acid N-acetyltransferase